MRPSHTKTIQPVEELSFVIAPPPHIKSDVSVLKDDVQFLTGEIFSDRYSSAQISLFRFDDTKHFTDIIREVEIKALTFDPFNIFLKDLKYFRQGTTHTIYLDVLNNFEVRGIFERLINAHAQYMPLISIASGLASGPFTKAWPHLADFRYRQDFLCDRISVLARRGSSWAHYRDLKFGTFNSHACE